MAQTVKLRRSASPGTPPTTSQLALGELAINTYDGKLFLKKNVSGTESIVEIGANNLADTFQVYEYSVTSNTTVFQGSDDNSNTLSYTTGSPPRVAVFLNGLLLDWGTDFTATNGSSVTLTSAAVSGDLVQIQAYKSTVVAGSNLMFNDGIKAQFGNDGDLEIYHDGSNSIINDTGTGNLQFQIGGSLIYSTTTDGIVLNNGLDVEANEFIGDLRGAVLFKAQAGEALSKGDVVYISGISGNTTIVSKADADDANKMPAFGVAATAISSGTTGDIYTFGTLSGLDTSSFTLGDELYVSTTAGALTNSAPTGSSAQIQKIAKVTRSDNSAGSIKIMGAGRSNATPNLDQYKIFVGNSSNQSVQGNNALTVDIDNNAVGINTGSPNAYGTSLNAGLHVATNAVINSNNPILYLRANGTSNISDLRFQNSLKFTNGAGSTLGTFGTNGDFVLENNASVAGELSALDGKLTIKEFTGTSSYTQIKKTNTGSNLALVSQESIYMMLDANNDQTNRSFQIVKNADAPGSGNTLFVVGEDGIVTSYGNVEIDTTNPQLTFRPDDGILFRFRVDETANRLELGHSSNKNLYLSNTGNSTFNYDLSVLGALSSTGDLTVGGNLTVNGTTTTLNTATLSVDDLNITIADGAANAAAANGAGITVDGASATLTYTSAEDRWNFNKKLYVQDSIKIAAASPSLVLQDTTDDDDHAIRFQDNGGTNRMSITTSGDDLNFETTGSRNFTFKGDTSGAGQVLIGDSTSYHSAAQLQIVGGGSTTSATYARMLLKDADGTNQHAFIEESGGSFNITAQNGTSDGTIKFSQYDGTTTSTRMTIEPGGNVGINETNPAAKLHIVESSTNGGALYLEDGTSWLRMVPNLGSGGYTGLSTAGDIGIIFSIDNDNTTDSSSNGLLIAPHTQTSGGLKILENGRVGIGVATPSTSLHIADAGDPTILLEDTSAANQMKIRYTASGVNWVSGVHGGVDKFKISKHTGFGTNDYFVIDNSGDVGIGTDSPDTKLDITAAGVNGIMMNQDTNSAATSARLMFKDSTRTNLIINVNGRLEFRTDATVNSSSGTYRVGVTPTLFDVTTPIKIEEYQIDTTETSTSATTQVVIHTMSASSFRSARYTIQVTNSTDSTYHTTEILMVHDGTTANITEFGKVFTANEEATFDADVSTGNVRLLATPATTDSMEFKVVCHSITV